MPPPTGDRSKMNQRERPPKNQLMALSVAVLQLTDMKAGEMMIAVLVIPSIYTIVNL
jgi:hypothetical protein